MGHHSIKMTVDVYGRLIPGANKAAVDRLDMMPPNAPYTHPEMVGKTAGELSS